MPRFGINYRINDKTVIRSGAGITVDPENYRFFRDSYPALVNLSVSGATTYIPIGALNAPTANPTINTLPSGVAVETDLYRSRRPAAPGTALLRASGELLGLVPEAGRGASADALSLVASLYPLRAVAAAVEAVAFVFAGIGVTDNDE